MPCPPSYEEMRFTSLDHESGALNTSLTRQLAEVPDTLLVANHIVLDTEDVGLKSKLEMLSAQLRAVLEKGDTPGLLSFEYPAGWPEMEDVARYEAFVSGLSKLDSEVELALCEIRTLFCANHSAVPKASSTSGTGFETLLQQEIERHKVHRELDRTAFLDTIRRDLRYHETTLEQDVSPTRRESAESYVAIYTAKIKAIEAIPIAQLLVDRSLF